MGRSRQNILIVSGIVVVMAGLGLIMHVASYEVWGGVLMIPVLTVVSIPLLRLFLRKDLSHLFNVLVLGFFLKMAGTILRFYVFAKVYGGVADATLYYNKGALIAASVRAGHKSLWSALPWARDLNFVVRLSGTVLTFTGPTRLGSFLVFGAFGFWGVVFLVVAACRAVPGLAQRRYAWFCALAPTLVFWPSSLGKEAWILLAIGVFSLGVARLLTWNHPMIGLLLAVAGGMGIGAVRIHLAVIFVAGAAVAFVQLLALPPVSAGPKRKGGAVLLAAVSTIVMGVLAYVSVQRLKLTNSGGDFLSGLDSALAKASLQSETGGSSFTPISTKNPTHWPYAIVRTLTRPLPIDVHTFSSLFPAAETSLYILLLVVGFRRIASLRPMLRRAPYLTYCLVCTLLFGLVFSSFGNLGILVRQRSLIAAFMLIVLCLPKAPSRFEKIAARWNTDTDTCTHTPTGTPSSTSQRTDAASRA